MVHESERCRGSPRAEARYRVRGGTDYTTSLAALCGLARRKAERRWSTEEKSLPEPTSHYSGKGRGTVSAAQRACHSLRPAPALAICGWSGAGKTPALERLVAELRAEGLLVAVVKHDAHGVSLDVEGKDSDRLFRAGASVHLTSPDEAFARTRPPEPLTTTLRTLSERHDLVLLEGHKTTALPKVWLLSEGETGPPPEVTNVVATLPGGEDRDRALRQTVEDWLRDQWAAAPLFGCVLIGGKSTRMGKPKHLLPAPGGTWLERLVGVMSKICDQVVVAGDGELPPGLAETVRLTDPPDLGGPMAGMLAAMRWAPRVCWLFAPCDVPCLDEDALRWLLGMRRPGVWAVMPMLADKPHPEPLLAYYDFRARHLLENLAAGGDFCPARICTHHHVLTPTPPAHLARAWRNVNTRRELGAQGAHPGCRNAE